MPETFAFFFAADGEDFFMISTGMSPEDVGKQAMVVLTKYPESRMRAEGHGFVIEDTASPSPALVLRLTWKWIPDSEVK